MAMTSVQSSLPATAVRLRAEHLVAAIRQALPALATVTLAASAAEIALLRLTSRIGVHIPSMTWAREGYRAAVSLGNWVFPLAAVFAGGLLAVMALVLALGRRRSAVPVVAAVAAVLAVDLLTLGQAPTGRLVAAHEALVAVALLAAGFAAAACDDGRGRGVRLFLALLVTGEALGQAQLATVNLVGDGVRTLPVAVLTAGEALTVAATLASPWLFGNPRRWDRRAVVAGAVVTLLVAGSVIGNPSTTRILALWTFGLAMPFPAALYAAAAGALAATIVALVRSGHAAEALGLLLIASGGYVPPNSYQAALLLSGVVVLAFPALLAAPAAGAVEEEVAVSPATADV